MNSAKKPVAVVIGAVEVNAVADEGLHGAGVAVFGGLEEFLFLTRERGRGQGQDE